VRRRGSGVSRTRGPALGLERGIDWVSRLGSRSGSCGVRRAFQMGLARVGVESVVVKL
jgi:hypothetical protein